MGKEDTSNNNYREFVKMPSALTEKACLNSIKEWVKKQPHLPQTISDDDLLKFLHCCYYSIEKTKKVIDGYYTIRTNTPEFFQNREVRSKKTKEMMDLVEFFQFENPTPKGEKILFFKLNNSDPEVYDYPEVTKYCMAVCDVYLEENGRQPGYVVLFDIEGLQLGHLTRMTMHLSLMKKEALYAQEALPFCLMGIHMINATPAVDALLNLVRPLVTSEILKIIHVHKLNEMDKFYDSIPQKILPKEYGGDAPTRKEQADAAAQKLLDNEKLVKFKETQKVNEKLRMSPSCLGDSLQGSFKKLELD